MQELNVPKSTFFHCEEYMKVKIMSRVLVGFGETTETRGHRTDTYTEMDMDFLDVCYTRAPKGQLHSQRTKYIKNPPAAGNNYEYALLHDLIMNTHYYQEWTC